MKLTIVGTGYVGLVSGTGFANLGNQVTCLDIDSDKIALLERGVLTIYEPGLEEIFRRNRAGGRLSFTTDTRQAVESAEIIFLCVGTPPDARQAADLTAVRAVAADIGRFMNGYKVVVNKSTAPVGTAQMVRRIIREHQDSPIDFDVVANPEFLREGVAVKDFENPERIIIGTDSPRAEEILSRLYRSLARTDRPIMVTGIPSAELIKYAANAMLATRISFMNQLAYLCEKTGADIKAISRGLGLDSRIGPRFLQAGIGYGGSCFPKDVKALVATLKTHGCPADLFEAVDRINEAQKTLVVDRLASRIDLAGSTVAIWGLSFKPKTDDIREAPALAIIARLEAAGAMVHAYDPVAMDRARAMLPRTRFFADPYEAIRDCDALLVVTEWDEFRNVDMRAVKVLLRRPLIVDGRNIYDPAELGALGMDYIGIGR
ncbi:MAG: UDP-glucose/GDP-mannose dehydrogenase family protein [Desulfobacterales bacterium]|jgi:UDPglucose 6-dehydrogenase|nr:UDP-glucose/GDP-mannose dehydrogenase family protein [Desulfobacteraceae bacterium]MDD3991316.1 UDP-glucose/GDP-mannose dehydrogenase family protein [Desulfobacteraceae bacterium]MDY0310631.1 UDP-glucose/GDP-mannose dehydrogenase family protein [Desulfobacterales bacterium]